MQCLSELRFNVNRYVHTLFNAFTCLGEHDEFLRELVRDTQRFDAEAFAEDVFGFSRDQCIREDKFNRLVTLIARLRTL